MNISILTIGSRGDAQPFAALALALAARGHRVRLIAPDAFQAMVEGGPVEFMPLDIDVHAQAQSKETRRLLKRSGSVVAYPLWLKQMFNQIAVEAARKALEGAQDADVIVGGSLGEPFAAMAAEYFGKPCVHAWNFPVIPSRDFLFTLSRSPPFALPGWLNKLLFMLGDHLVWRLLRPWMQDIRTQFGLGPAGPLSPLRQAVENGETVLFPYSPTLLPPSREWPSHVEVTGYWRLARAPTWTPPERLAAFLAAGPPAIYVGFGSMPVSDREGTVSMVLKAIRIARIRAVIATGWSGLTPDNSAEDVLFIDEAPHDWLFERVVAVVHHGGAGTTGAALAAGKPSFVTPFMLDQFFWADLAHKRELSPRPIPFVRLTSATLAAGIGAAVDEWQWRVNAEAMGAAVRAEDGLQRAVLATEAAAGWSWGRAAN